jgi:hypothetical protein
MKHPRLMALVCGCLPIPSLAAGPSDMIGTWRFDPALSRNAGPMAQASVITSISLSGEDRHLARGGMVMIVQSRRAGAAGITMAFIRK